MGQWVYIEDGKVQGGDAGARADLDRFLGASGVTADRYGRIPAGAVGAGGQGHFFELDAEAAARFRASAASQDGWRVLVGDPPAAGAVAGATGAAATGGLRKWLPWILGALALLALFLILRSCGGRREYPATPTSTTSTTTVTSTTATPAIATPTESVTLPGGAKYELARGTLNYELQAFLASAEPAPRRFEFDHLNFDTASATLQPDAGETLDPLAAILKAYPNTRAEIVGFTDARGTADANKTLSDDRARAAVQGLVQRGIEASRLGVAGAGESDPAATNATPGGRAENRRAELVVTAK